jgi:hypothetical protein
MVLFVMRKKARGVSEKTDPHFGVKTLIQNNVPYIM